MIRTICRGSLMLPGLSRIFAAPASSASIARSAEKWISATSGTSTFARSSRMPPYPLSSAPPSAPGCIRPPPTFDLPHARRDIRRIDLRHRLYGHGTVAPIRTCPINTALLVRLCMIVPALICYFLCMPQKYGGYCRFNTLARQWNSTVPDPSGARTFMAGRPPCHSR